MVSITDLDDNTSCATSVDWKAGAGRGVCRTLLIHGGGVPVGDTLDHCTNPNVVGCNSLLERDDALVPLVVPHTFRFIGLLITHGLIFRLLVRGEPILLTMPRG